MKKYSILFVLAALSGCSLLPAEILSKEFIVEDIGGEGIPTALDNLTLVYGKVRGMELDLRFTNGYVALKGDSFDTYAARIVKIASAGANEYKLFISDGSRTKGKLRINALYVTDVGQGIYGYGLTNGVNVDAPFPEVYNSAIPGPSQGEIFLGWAVNEANKPTTFLPTSHQGTYKGTLGSAQYKVSAIGVTQVHSGYSNPEDKFLRVKVNGAEYECYTSQGAYKITANEISSGRSDNPAIDVTFWNPTATRP